MKATIENVINNTADINNLRFGWMLIKNPKNTHQYQLVLHETTFYPEYAKFECSATKDEYSKFAKQIIKSPFYDKLLEARHIAVEKWFNDYNIYSGIDLAFYGDSPEQIKNNICFSKICPYVDPTKMEIIELS